MCRLDRTYVSDIERGLRKVRRALDLDIKPHLWGNAGKPRHLA